MSAGSWLEVHLQWEGEVVWIARRRVPRTSRVLLGALRIPALDEALATHECALPTRSGDSTRVTVGALAVELTLVGAAHAQAFAIDTRAWASHSFSCALHALFLLLGMWTWPAFAAASGEGDADRAIAIRDFEAVIRAKSGDDTRTVPQNETRASSDPLAASGSSTTDGARGAARVPAAATADAMRGAPRSGRETARADALREARTFGMLGLLSDGAAQANVAAAWPEEGLPSGSAGVGDDDLFGTSLSGVGEGGGGSGSGIALGAVRTGGCGGNCGAFDLKRTGRSARLGDRYATRAAVRCGIELTPANIDKPCPGTQVNGRLPPETIQRIVRQNFGRFRNCYEAGLDKNPTLAGRVTVKFVIARDGSVSESQDGGSDVPNASVVGCVVRAMTTLSFPEPTGGIVTVVYPLVLTTM